MHGTSRQTGLGALLFGLTCMMVLPTATIGNEPAIFQKSGDRPADAGRDDPAAAACPPPEPSGDGRDPRHTAGQPGAGAGACVRRTAGGRCSPASPAARPPPAQARLPRRHHRPPQHHRVVRPLPRPQPGCRHRAPGPDVLDVDYGGPRGTASPAQGRLRLGRVARRRLTAMDPDPSGGCTSTSPGRPALRPPARQPPRFPLGRRLRPRPAVPGRRQTLSADRRTRRPVRPGLAAGHRPARTHPHLPGHSQRAGRCHQTDHLARAAGGRQPERGPVLGREPSPRNRPRSQPGRTRGPARQAGLKDREITATLNSARRTARQRQPTSPQAQAQAEVEA